MNVAIIVAGGKGIRFGSARPKQFLELNGVPIIIHTLKQFERSREIEKVVIVLPAEETAGFQSLVREFGLTKIASIVAGGPTRAQSVRRGLAAIEDAGIVAVHDGVRPLVTPEEIDRVVQAAQRTGAAILVAPIGDTVKEIESEQITRTLPRATLRRALTPQSFRLNILRRAYEPLNDLESAGIEVTDDSFLVERLGVKVSAVEASARNLKITTAEDLAQAEAILKM